MKKIIVLLLPLVLIIASCVKYKQVSISEEMFLSNQGLVESLKKRDSYAHDGVNTYKLKNIEVKDSIITADVEKQIISPTEINAIKSPSKKDIKKHRYDINIYTRHDLGNMIASNSKELNSEVRRVIIKPENIEKIDAYSVNKKATTSINLLLGILLTVVIVIGVIYIINAVTKSSGESGESSGKSKGSSDSDSDSKGSSESSGNSSGKDDPSEIVNAPGSEMGSGNSSTTESTASSKKGCYIASMVYGSYDAPEVIVLRKFRDNTLSNYYAGRKFIQAYYHFSPKFVARFNNYKFVHTIIKSVLDKWVNYLNTK